MVSRYTREERAFIKEIFDLFDVDRSGAISLDELEPLLAALGLKGLVDADLEKIVEKYDLDGSGDIDFEEFLVGEHFFSPKVATLSVEKY